MICWVYTSPLGLNDILITPENTYIRELPAAIQSAFRGAAIFGVINLTIYAQFHGLNISIAQAAVIEHGYYVTQITISILNSWPIILNTPAATMSAIDERVAANIGLTLIRIQQVETQACECLGHLNIEDVDELWRQLHYMDFADRMQIYDAIMLDATYAAIPSDLPEVLDDFITMADQFSRRAFTYPEFRLDRTPGLNAADSMLQEMHAIMDAVQRLVGTIRSNLMKAHIHTGF